MPSPPRFLTYELPAKITSMPYIQAAPPRWAEEPMVIKFWEHLQSSPSPWPFFFARRTSRRSRARRLTYHRGDAMQKESEFRQRAIRGDRCEGCDREQDAQEFLWIFFIAPAVPESRVKREKARDMARSRSEEGEVLSLSFFELLMELANFSAPPVFSLPLIQADFYAITIASFSSSISSLMAHRFM